MQPVFVFLSAFVVGTVWGTDGAEEPKPAPQLLVGVERSLPVRGQTCRLWAEIEPGGEGVKFTAAEVEWVVQWDGEEPTSLARKSVAWPADGKPVPAEVSWTPERTGPSRISARATLAVEEGDPVRLTASPVEVFVTSRKLHFNYWACAPNQRYVTSVMDNSQEGDPPQRWRRRGVLPLVWKGGHWLWQQEGFNQPEKIAENWLSVPEGRVGIMIDELGGGGEVDEQLGQALLLTRLQAPELFLAPYCVGVSGAKMSAGFRQSDLILVETYTSDWRGDGTITGRWRSAAEAGLTDKSIAVLGVGRQWTTTEKELRRIFQMVRATCPEMPGLGFFPEVPPRLARAVDAAIEEYFLRPVVSVSVREGTAVIRNVGETPAVDVKIVFLDADRQRLNGNPPGLVPGDRAVPPTIPRLAPWSTAELPLPPGAVGAAVVPAPDRYTALDYVPPLEQPPPDAEAREAALAFRQRVLEGQAIDPLERANEMQIERSDTKHEDPHYHHNISAATIPLPASQGRPVALTFDLRLGRAWFYGGNSISLAGQGVLSLGWSHSDHDAGLSGDQPRPTLSFTGTDGYTVCDVPTMGFRPGQTYHVLLTYDGREAVRAIVTDETDALLWDSGSVPAEGGWACHELRFGVRAFQGSDIRVDPEKREVFLRGVSGGPIPSPYVLESTLSNFRLVLGPTGE